MLSSTGDDICVSNTELIDLSVAEDIKCYFWMKSMKINIGKDWSHLNDKCSKLKLLKCS